MFKKQWQSILMQKLGYENIWRGSGFLIILDLFCSLLFYGFSVWLFGFPLVFSIFLQCFMWSSFLDYTFNIFCVLSLSLWPFTFLPLLFKFSQ